MTRRADGFLIEPAADHAYLELLKAGIGAAAIMLGKPPEMLEPQHAATTIAVMADLIARAALDKMTAFNPSLPPANEGPVQ